MALFAKAVTVDFFFPPAHSLIPQIVLYPAQKDIFIRLVILTHWVEQYYTTIFLSVMG